jgi:multidrug efflux pump subunit AcrB
MKVSTTPASAGRWVPVNELATWKENRTFTTLHRSQQFRSISITADVDYMKNNLDNIMTNFRQNTVAEIKQKYPGVQIEFLGTAEERDKSFAGLFKALPIALMMIYMQLAGLFRSYLQPLVVMMAIPFGLEGAILGHWFFGQSITILSCIGMVALTGILVNDALVMMDFINLRIFRCQHNDWHGRL